MTFSIEHDFDDLFKKMHDIKIFNENTFVSILKKASKPLMAELDKSGPDSLRSFASSSGGSYSKSAEASRAKYGQLQKSLGAYKSRSKNKIGEHSINLGYLPSKQDKAFVAHFLNYGWKEAKTGRVINTEHQGWMQKAEQKTYPMMKEIFDREVEKTFEEHVNRKWQKTKMRKVK